MERTWRSTAAGILSIVAGIVGAITGLVVVVIIFLAGASLEFLLQIASEPYQEIPTLAWFEPGILIVILVIAVLAIAGGICALKRRIWGLALAGSICALVPLVIPGILAIIFVSQSKGEFDAVVVEKMAEDT